MATLKLTKYKLLVLYAFCHYMSSEPASSQQGSSEGISSHFAHALLYHQFQPTPAPLLSRYNRQPHPSSSSNASHYADSAQNYQDTRHQQRLQTSFLNARDSSSDEFAEDPYGCPVECQCNKIAQIADCSNRNLSRVPVSFPKDIKRIRLERNNITDIGPYAFQGLKRLQRIDLSNNNLYKIDALAFSGGLQALNSLILYSNKLEHLPVNVFNELSQLQLLLLNANSLQTIHKDLFHALANLNLLSLYDNNIATLSSGTFDGLRNIKTIHLGKNPLNCDCSLRWLANYFEANPVETSEARCETPTRAQGRRLSELTRNDFKCQELQSSSPQIPLSQQAATSDSTTCPAGCVCNGSTVDCSRAPAPPSESRSGGGTYELPEVPDDVPVYVTRVHINDNRIKRIRQTGLFRLANSQKLDLGNNKIVDIEDNAINGQFSNGQKPQRVVFVLIENQHCDAPTASPDFAQPGGAQTKSGRPATSRQQQAPEDPCAMAPKVNDPQFDSACYNGGTCKPISNSQYANYSCSCPAGFAGPLCEINIDDCVDHQCQNGAMCVDGINSYKCICRDPTTTGEFCEQMYPLGTTGYGAASSANSIAPLALPIIAAGSASLMNGIPAVGSAAHEASMPHGSPTVQPQQITARSADNLRAPDELAANSLAQSSSAKSASVQPQQQQPECNRLTQRKYFDDGNGCQSVRVLKISECSGSCGGQGAGAGCCLPAKVKRRRIRMQCSDGASYVKTVDLIKKCACTNDASCSAQEPSAFLASSLTPADQSKLQKTASQGANYYKSLAQQKPRSQLPVGAANRYSAASPFNVTEEDQLLQIARLDAVD